MSLLLVYLYRPVPSNLLCLEILNDAGEAGLPLLYSFYRYRISGLRSGTLHLNTHFNHFLEVFPKTLFFQSFGTPVFELIILVT